MQKKSSTKTQLDEFTTKFEKDFSLVSHISTSTSIRTAQFFDIGACFHMIEVWK
jgi:hypothetical protein